MACCGFVSLSFVHLSFNIGNTFENTHDEFGFLSIWNWISSNSVYFLTISTVTRGERELENSRTFDSYVRFTQFPYFVYSIDERDCIVSGHNHAFRAWSFHVSCVRSYFPPFRLAVRCLPRTSYCIEREKEHTWVKYVVHMSHLCWFSE